MPSWASLWPWPPWLVTNHQSMFHPLFNGHALATTPTQFQPPRCHTEVISIIQSSNKPIKGK